MTDTSTNLIPQPKPAPIVGNIPDIDANAPVQGMMRMARQYGPIFRLEIPGRDMLVISSQALVNELCDEQRFDKKVHAPLREIREFAGDGLFTAETQEPNWGKAHRILMPAFGPAALRTMYSGMLDIAEQLLVKWERQGPEQVIDLVDNTTRLTLDTIALCAFDYRFNSFYERDMHPFVGAMVRALSESGMRTRRLPLQNRLMLITRRQYDEDIRYMHQIADELINERKKQGDPEGRKDILSTMLNSRDPQTGERLSDENIRYQMVTFLIAGHETTSGLLSFTIYELLKHPEVLERVRAEVEKVVGNRTPAFEDLPKLVYLDQVLKETLRLWPTAPAFAVYPYADETFIGGKYPVRKDQTLFMLTPMLHRDPAVWGENAEEFNPDHFAFEAAEKLPPNAWKPFGNGQRSCIGRPFALQEAALFLAMLVQRFDLSLADPSYELKIKETLTMKPDGLYIRAWRRANVTIEAPRVPVSNTLPSAEPAEQAGPQTSNGIGIKVLFGSNAGSSEAFAQRIATDARAQGYVPTIAPLDEAVDNLPKDGAVVIVTASYEGQPPDNARKFVDWLEKQPAGSLQGVKYTVFGCGNKDWARTYQAVPKLIDRKLEEAGAERLIERGEANARGDFFGDFDLWYKSFWPEIGEAFGQETRKPASLPLFEVEFVAGTRDPLVRQNNLQFGTVVENRELANLSAPYARSRRHVEIELPEGASYRAGDYLAVLPPNPPDMVDRALRRFALPYDAQVVLHMSPGGQTFFPLNQPIMAGELLSSYVELGGAATRSQIEQLISATPCPPEKKALEALVASVEAYEEKVLDKRVSLLDLLEDTASSSLSFASFLQMLQPMKPRRYSISSSPLWSAEHCTLTFSVVEGPAWSGKGLYQGAASTYLAHSRPGAKVAVMTRPSNAAFHLPASPETPVIMVCAGTGIAPFRGFLQERAIQASQGQPLAKALLFFGCDHPEVDFLYKDELQAWEDQGVVSVRPAFSKEPREGVKYVQDRLWQDRAEVIELVKQGAILYLCGDGRNMAPAVHETCVRIYREATGASSQEAESWMDEMERKHARYVADLFA
ncbi:MAG TPA: cytochrome P450 [Chloroflexia bacterium]|nr:cytochrome P450 [Chloroflexia bacterium]